MKSWISAKNALKHVLLLGIGEKTLLVVDKSKLREAMQFIKACLALGSWVRTVKAEPKNLKFIREVIASSRPSIIVNLLKGDIEGVSFRIKLLKIESEFCGLKIAHCPGITMDMLREGALALTSDEYRLMQNEALRLMFKLSGSDKIILQTPKGTHLEVSVKGRPFFTDTKFDPSIVKWINLPVGEVIVGPREHEGSGVLVCDVAVGGIGPISRTLTLHFKRGRIEEIEGDEEIVNRIRRALFKDDMASRIGEFAIGLNPKARVSSDFLEAEKVRGTAHIAVGHNKDFPGGMNDSKIHIDFLVSKPTVVAIKDGKENLVVEEGRIVEDS
ncbi:MAG: hypothetical protein DRJ60_06635 [Thermoprotei archaeon]|nr:MAG: hypothetical protein DRJ60_06635 [Thermoprotei archaeon]